MDWSKAKNILILIFIVLNVFLLVYLGVYTKSSNVSKEAVISTLNVLKKNGIVIAPMCEIPKYNKKTPMLMLEGENSFVFSNDSSLDSNNSNTNDSNTNKNIDINKNMDFQKNIDIDNIKNAEKYSRAYLETQDIKISNFILDKYFKNSDKIVTLVFIEKYKGFLIFDNKISVSISENGIKNIASNIKKIKGFTKTPSVIMPAHQVLLKNFYNKKDITIKSIDIGFKGFNSEDYGQESKETYQGPAWRITTDEGMEIFLKAYDGEEID